MTDETDGQKLFWASLAWVDDDWRENVLLEVDSQGYWANITTQISAPADAVQLTGPVLPGLTNAHSHAFQRAFAGRAEQRHSSSDNFWSWRDRMYRVANRVTPAQLQTIATQLYAELLEGGYTHVCEFHYLHHALAESFINDKFAMTWALTNAAAQAGIGLTVLPVLYERSGFEANGLRADQARFAADVNFVLQIKQAVDAANLHMVNTGVAIHSLRATHTTSIHALTTAMQSSDGPIHIHVAEQQNEVQDCLNSTGKRPVEWLCSQGFMDKRWQLVHATHVTAVEIDSVAKTGAQLVICPSTEANLGDGFTDVPLWLSSGAGMAIGSDSHVSRSWREELRWLEYGQRLRLQQRNIVAAPESGVTSTAQRLFNLALVGGSSAAGQVSTGFLTGARADMVVLDIRSNGLLGIPKNTILDALIFANDTSGIDSVYVAGKQVVKHGKHIASTRIADHYIHAIHELN